MRREVKEGSDEELRMYIVESMKIILEYVEMIEERNEINYIGVEVIWDMIVKIVEIYIKLDKKCENGKTLKCEY